MPMLIEGHGLLLNQFRVMVTHFSLIPFCYWLRRPMDMMRAIIAMTVDYLKFVPSVFIPLMANIVRTVI